MLDKLCLLCGEVTVSKHSLEAYLIKFKKKKHYDAAYRRRRIKRNGIVLCLQPYRSLENVILARFFFHVCIFLEGVPRYARTPDIMERLLGRSCNVVHRDRSTASNRYSWHLSVGVVPQPEQNS